MPKFAPHLIKICSCLASLATANGFFCGTLVFMVAESNPCQAAVPPDLLTDEGYQNQNAQSLEPSKNPLRRPDPASQSLILFYPSYQDLGRGMDARSIEPVQPANVITSADVGRVIPAQRMKDSCQTSPTSPSTPVATTIFGYSMSNYLQSPSVKQSSVGHTANTVQESMKTEASFGGTQPGTVKHSFAFNVNPFETKAEMKYSGFTNASLTYNAGVSKLDFEMYRDLDKTTKLVFNHTDTPADHREILSLRWTAW